jgi:threonine synthase
LIERGPRSIWRYAPLLPVAAPVAPRLAPGLTPLVPAPRLASALGIGELYLKLDTANPTHSFKDRVVAVAAAKALELGCETLACSSTGNLATRPPRGQCEGLEAVVFCPPPRRSSLTAVYGPRFTSRRQLDDPAGSTVELSFSSTGHSQRRPALVLRRGLGRSRSGRRQLGWRPHRGGLPHRPGAFSKVHQGFAELRELGLVEGDTPRLYGGQ